MIIDLIVKSNRGAIRELSVVRHLIFVFAADPSFVGLHLSVVGLDAEAVRSVSRTSI